MLFHTTLVSRNAKTGPIPVVTSSRNTCPPTCPFIEKGCYAATGPLALHWDKVDSGERGVDLDTALIPIRKLSRGSLWRYGQAGDLPGEGDAIDAEGMRKLTRANAGKRAIVFTHKPPTPENLAVLREAARGGLVVNLSANNLAHADQLAEEDLPTVVVLPIEYGRERNEALGDYKRRTKNLKRNTPAGRKIAICPATYTDISCSQCGICADGDRRGVVVGFPAHGTRRKHVSSIAAVT